MHKVEARSKTAYRLSTIYATVSNPEDYSAKHDMRDIEQNLIATMVKP